MDKPAKKKVFNPKDLSIQEQEAVVEEYFGYHPKYFLHDGLNLKFNLSRFESDNRSMAAETGKPRKWFNGWKHKENN